MARRIEDIVSEWPPSSWAGSYSGLDPLSPQGQGATVVDAVLRRESIRLVVQSDRREFSTSLSVSDPRLRRAVAETLRSAKGLTLEAAGKLAVEGSDATKETHQ